MIEDPAKVGYIAAAAGSAVRKDVVETEAGSGPATAARRVRPYATMMLALRIIFAVATIAVICLGAYYLIERNQAREEAAAEPMVEPVDPGLESLRDARKKAREASKLAVAEGCTGLNADYEVWEDYLDKKTRRKLKALIEKCNREGEAQITAEP